MKKIIETDKAPAPIGPYNQAVVHHGLLYMSGQIAIDAGSGELVNNHIQEETNQVMRNIKAILDEAGSSFEQVIKCTIFISDMDQFNAINKEYDQYFDSATAPARECVEVARLPKDVNVEISLIAAV